MSFDFDKAEEQFEDFNAKHRLTYEQQEAMERINRDSEEFIRRFREALLPKSRLTKDQGERLQLDLMTLASEAELPDDLERHLLNRFLRYVAEVTIDPL